MKVNYDKFMKIAINEAQKAYLLGEVPIGCVITKDNKVIAKAFNKRNKNKNALFHAEILAINKACTKMSDWRLEECTIFVTIEPCCMCAGAILQARFKTLVFGSPNHKFGCCGSVINILENKNFNHKVSIVSNVMQKECNLIMKKFFREIRDKK